MNVLHTNIRDFQENALDHVVGPVHENFFRLFRPDLEQAAVFFVDADFFNVQFRLRIELEHVPDVIDVDGSDKGLFFAAEQLLFDRGGAFFH